jgi:hypothetical protein
MKTNNSNPMNTIKQNESMRNSKTANEGKNDKAKETQVSAATAPIENTSQGDDDILEEFEEMKEEVAPHFENFQQALSSVEDHRAIGKLHKLFNETLEGLYDDWEEIRGYYDSNTLEERIEEYGGQKEVEKLRRKMLSTEKEFTELLPCLDDPRDILEYCECNCYFREKISEMIADRLGKFEAKNEQAA